MKNNRGKVFFIGAGPGDPGLITLKGVECIAKAHVVIYDYLASSMLLQHAKSNAEIIYVGKKRGEHTLSQDSINKLIIIKAKSGRNVARLKGGDPFIFGRGGEEAEALVTAGIEFEVIPGITSGIAASAYAGIPLTHRKYTSDITFVTGHEDPKKQLSNINWLSLGRGTGTLVFFMGVKNLKKIVDNLKINGRVLDTPVAVIRWGTTTKQQTIVGNLSSIVEKCNNLAIKPPAIIVVGTVVNLRKTMRWFDNRQLTGKTIVVTRARAQASDLVEKLSQLGANCLECPTIEVIKPYDWTEVDRAIDNIKEYDWLIFTSTNGVDFFFQRLFEKDKDIRDIANIKTAVIGPATARRLLSFGLKSDIIPKTYCAESVVDAFLNQSVAGKRICLPRAMKARPLIPIELTKMGAVVDEIAVYQTVKSEVGINNLIRKLEDGTIYMITFTSSSTVSNFSNMFSKEKLKLLLKGVLIATIGPVTAKTARLLGFKVDIVSRDYTIEGLCNSITNHLS